MSEKKYLRNKRCCGCEIRLDRVGKRKIINIKIEDSEKINEIRLNNKQSQRTIESIDHLCIACYCKLNNLKKAEKEGIITLRSDREFSMPSTSGQTSTSVPQTSSPVAKRIAFNPPVSSSESSENNSPPSSPNLNSTFEDLEVATEESSLTLLIPVTVKTHCRCLICPNVRNNLHRISSDVQLDFMIKHGIWISDDSRICSEHLRNDKTIKPDHEDLITIYSKTSDWSKEEVLSLIDRLRDAAKKEPQNLFENFDLVSEEKCKNITGLTKYFFADLLERCPTLRTKADSTVMLAVYLFRLRNAISLRVTAVIFGIRSYQIVARMINETRNCLMEDLVSKKLGIENLSRNDLLVEQTNIARELFNARHNLITIWDGSYAYCQKSSNYFIQKTTYSLQKKRHLCKPFIGITSNGYYLDVIKPYDALSNDASIMNQLLDQESFRNFFREGDLFVVDRGFRDSLKHFEKYGFRYAMPACLSKKQKQLTWQEANRSRKVTKVRYAVEVAIGRLKRFKYLDQVIQNTTLPHVYEDFKIVATILNLQYNSIESDLGFQRLIVEKMLARENIPNTLQPYIDEHNLDMKRANFKKLESCEIIDFPQLSMEDLYFITLGSYQLKQSLSYIAQHLDRKGSFWLEAFKDKIEEDNLIRAKLLSRHSRSVKYNIYIRYSSSKSGTDGIIAWMCRCKNGLRTLGCCAHIASVLFYFGYGRHQETIRTPAAFLNNLFPHAEPVLLESSDEEQNESEN